jgi:hypothetical protein
MAPVASPGWRVLPLLSLMELWVEVPAIIFLLSAGAIVLVEVVAESEVLVSPLLLPQAVAASSIRANPRLLAFS